MQPIRVGVLGETEFADNKTWVCKGGTEWVDKIEREEPPLEMWPYLTTPVARQSPEKFSSRCVRAWRVLTGRE